MRSWTRLIMQSDAEKMAVNDENPRTKTTKGPI